MQLSTSPYASAAARASAAPGASHDPARAARGHEALKDSWVTVFGFGPSDLPLVIREFSKAGDIAQVGGLAGWAGLAGLGWDEGNHGVTLCCVIRPRG